MINYQNLLMKYIDHVGNCEGVCFIPDKAGKGNIFTQEEISILQDLEKKSLLEYHKKS